MNEESQMYHNRGNWYKFALILLAALILEGTSIVQLRFLKRSSLAHAEQEALNVLSTTQYEILDVVDATEQAVRNNMWITQWSLAKPDSLWSVTRLIVEGTPAVVGSTVALVPGYNKKYPLFSPYTYQKGDSLIQRSLATEVYDYPRHEWFTEPLSLGHSYWSEPYLDQDGGEQMMTTYSNVVYDQKGTAAAVITADVSLEWLSDHVGRVEIYPEAFSILISRLGQVILGPIDSLAMNFFTGDIARKMEGNQGFTELLADMMDGREGVMSLNSPRGIVDVYYAPVPRTGWSMAVVIPEVEIYKEVRQIAFICTLLQILGLVMLILLLHSTARSWLDSQRARDNEERLEGELQIARDIQMSMIPKELPSHKEMDIAASIAPAKQVGGDLYDYYIRDNKLVFCIGDVSGKGVPASLVMAVTRSLFRNISAREDNPALIVQGINDSMADFNDSGMFVTFFCGLYDLGTGELRYCNAGHNPPLILTDHIEKLEVLPNLPLGVLPGMTFEGQRMGLKADDALFLYTDGVTEAENESHELFGEERMEAVLHPRRSAQGQLEAMSEAVVRFVDGAPQSDDITMLFIHVLKNLTPVTNMRHLILHNDIQQITLLADFVDTLAAETGLDPATAMSLNLALEEAVTNVILYAYPEGTDGLVEIKAQIKDDELVFSLEDSGKPFDPTAAPDADVTLGVEERKIGGLGIYLVRNIMDRVSYKYENGKNILTMIKQIIH